MISDFKVGDRVIITKKLEYYIKNRGWSTKMYDLINGEFIISDIQSDIQGNKIVLKDFGFYVYEDCIELLGDDIKIKWINKK